MDYTIIPCIIPDHLQDFLYPDHGLAKAHLILIPTTRCELDKLGDGLVGMLGHRLTFCLSPHDRSTTDQ